QPHRTSPIAAALLAAAMAIMMAGCVTEDAPRRPVARNSAGTSSVPPALPSGPIAAPSRGLSTSSRVLIGLAPIGVVPYDGQILPLISPDGRMCAVQQGDPASWPTLLAAPDAEFPAFSSLAVFDLTTSPPSRIDTASSIPPGMLLGRACDHRGFLVESPRPDGARWIGRVSWQSGDIEWLARDQGVCSHGMLMADGSLLYTRRSIESQVTELVLRTPSGATAVRGDPNLPYAMPMATSDPSVVYALMLTTSGIELHALNVKTEGAAPRLGPVIARRLVSSARDIATAYQIAAPVQAPFPRSAATDASQPPDPLIIFSPLVGRIAVFDVRTSALMPLSQGSVAAARWNNATRPGYLCTTPKGLVFAAEPQPGRSAESQPPDARLLAEAYVPRRTLDPARPAILLGPVRSDPRLLELIAIAPADDAAKQP
ncbi:MAG TPA: hypothetical protein VK176_06780, partial [Phycisphaerales bacterium]|nr:hypothetical protein [Phycisphaerales bacterium]